MGSPQKPHYSRQRNTTLQSALIFKREANAIDCSQLGNIKQTSIERHQKWINRQITAAAESSDIAWLLDVVQANLPEMNLINFSTALHRIAKLALGCSVQTRESLVEHAAIKELRRLVVLHVQEKVGVEGGGLGAQSEMRCLSIICWSCATLRIREAALFEHTSAVSGERLTEMKPFELSNMLWAFAKLSFGYSAIFERLTPHLLHRKPGQFSPQCLSTIMWAFGTAKVHQASVFTSIARELSNNVSAMAPQGIANTAWAFARVHRQEAQLFRMLAKATAQDSMVWSFKPQELSNIVWAFATLGLTHPLLFEKIVEVAIHRRAELPPQNVANMLWAYAKLAVPSRWRLFPPLLEVAVQRLEAYKPQEISAILWAVAREVNCSPFCHQLFSAVPERFGGRLHEFTTQALACMVEAYGLAEVDGQNFFNGIMKESIGRLDSFQPPSLCTLLRGVALKARRHEDQDDGATLEFTKAISDHIAYRLGEMQQHNLAHLVQTLDALPREIRETSCQLLDGSATLATIQISQGIVGYQDADASSMLAMEKGHLMDPSGVEGLSSDHYDMPVHLSTPDDGRRFLPRACEPADEPQLLRMKSHDTPPQECSGSSGDSMQICELPEALPPFGSAPPGLSLARSGSSGDSMQSCEFPKALPSFGSAPPGLSLEGTAMRRSHRSEFGAVGSHLRSTPGNGVVLGGWDVQSSASWQSIKVKSHGR